MVEFDEAKWTPIIKQIFEENPSIGPGLYRTKLAKETGEVDHKRGGTKFARRALEFKTPEFMRMYRDYIEQYAPEAERRVQEAQAQALEDKRKQTQEQLRRLNPVVAIPAMANKQMGALAKKAGGSYEKDTGKKAAPEPPASTTTTPSPRQQATRRPIGSGTRFLWTVTIVFVLVAVALFAIGDTSGLAEITAGISILAVVLSLLVFGVSRLR